MNTIETAPDHRLVSALGQLYQEIKTLQTAADAFKPRDWRGDHTRRQLGRKQNLRTRVEEEISKREQRRIDVENWGDAVDFDKPVDTAAAGVLQLVELNKKRAKA